VRDPFYSTAPNFLANWNENAKKQADANSESDMTVYNSQTHQHECGDIYIGGKQQNIIVCTKG
jgi:hypothetical protein